MSYSLKHLGKLFHLFSVDIFIILPGYCSVLNLVKGLTPAHSKTVAAFRRMTSNANVPIYVSTGSERAHLFYNQRLQSWAIGKYYYYIIFPIICLVVIYIYPVINVDTVFN